MNKIFNLMILATSLVLISTQAAVAGPEDKPWTKVISCEINDMGLKLFEVFQQENEYILEVVSQKNEVTLRGLTTAEYEKSNYYLAHNGDLSLYLEKQRVDQYIFEYAIFIKGDGHNYSFPINCIE